MGKLERYRGHFYNWYDTRTLHPLAPLYVSSVDSGNLGGHLLTLGPGSWSLGMRRLLARELLKDSKTRFVCLMEVARGAVCFAGAADRRLLRRYVIQLQ